MEKSPSSIVDVMREHGFTEEQIRDMDLPASYDEDKTDTAAVSRPKAPTTADTTSEVIEEYTKDDWGRGAECAGENPDIFEDPRHRQKAREICGRCAVQSFCLEYALKADEPVGMWGGMTPDERRTLLSSRRYGKR